MPGDAQSIQLATTQKHAASITHEVSQPLGGIVTNAEASLRWLETPNIAEARSAVERIALAAHRGSAVISRTRELSKKPIRVRIRAPRLCGHGLPGEVGCCQAAVAMERRAVQWEALMARRIDSIRIATVGRRHAGRHTRAGGRRDAGTAP
jgi:signal transduction histidine kinase